MTKKKKVLIDLSILKHRYCGTGQVALNYGKYFKENYFADKEDYQVYLLVPKNMIGEFGNEVKYLSINAVRKYFPIFFPKFDVWHAMQQLSPYKPVHSATKFILTIHDFNFMYEKKSLKKQNRYLKQIQKKVTRADRIVCISEFTKKEAEKYANLGGKKIDVIYNGIEFLDEKQAIKPAFVTSDKPFFFTIGQVKKKKNFHVLLPLMKLFPEKELYICGRDAGGYAEEIRNKIKAENIQNVHLTGIISDNERIWMYKNCEAFLFPSLFEGFGLPVIEAMLFGKPVFSSAETSLKEIGDKHAFFWNSFDAGEMKKLIDENLEKYNNSASAKEESISYAKSFSYTNHLQQYINIYKTI
ncbi:glycosyltransferase family 1 protein [Paludibacter sp. 221]|uniref:glycosyltransferase family 4 protein n=1 Tax=Paludibacter sp. 221 TaxID=2302939 RepID=UPI0013D14B87|nr:glycosyltransferase family 1 protein [Paludibacter sp. 221]NDV47866.1 glycosyltransferase family 1 protein [Paludibacter sp. 221]